METTSSKVIRGQDSQRLEQWRPPTMTAEAGAEPGSPDGGAPPTAAELEAIQKQAYEEGYAEGREQGFEYGHREGLAQARQQVQEYCSRLDRVVQTLDRPLERLDEQVEQELLQLVIAMVRQLVRRELRADPQQIIGVIREAVGILPVASRNVRLLLHPDDARLVRETYSLTETELGWRVQEDPVMGRGGCKVISDSSQIDATLESRLSALIAPLLGGERTEDRNDGEDE